MLIYFLLVVAIFLEVAGTLLLPATQNFSRIFPTVIMVVCYLGSFFLLTFVIKVLPISIVYATWSGLGVFTVAILGYFLFGQSLSWQAICGLFLIVIGVAIVNVFNSAHS
jgi:small multidrug resistance pump|tara:strand:- start:136 stop:465 length:330 start_codon:yes stop_codon:yes gene_type:complete